MSALKARPRDLYPLPKDLWGLACSTCDKVQARWTVNGKTPELEAMCSVCYLEQSDWARQSTGEISQAVAVLSSSKKREWMLSAPNDADALLMMLAMTDRFSRLVRKDR